MTTQLTAAKETLLLRKDLMKVLLTSLYVMNNQIPFKYLDIWIFCFKILFSTITDDLEIEYLFLFDFSRHEDLN